MTAKLYGTWMLRGVLLVAVVAGLIKLTTNGAPSETNAIIKDPARLVGCPAADFRSLANGVYAVVREGLTAAEVKTENLPNAVLIYDRKYSAGDKDQPPKHVALDTSCFVPLVLAGPPDLRRDDRGRALLAVTLAQQHVKTLEDFTRAHLGGAIAIVVDSEIITMHKVRTVIRDGRTQISRCSDDACRILRLKLAK